MFIFLTFSLEFTQSFNTVASWKYIPISMNIFQGVRGTNYFKLLYLQTPLFIGVLPSNLAPVQAAFLHPFYNQLSTTLYKKASFSPLSTILWYIFPGRNPFLLLCQRKKRRRSSSWDTAFCCSPLDSSSFS